MGQSRSGDRGRVVGDRVARFYFYLTTIASYGSVFGSLAAVIVVMAYLYISATVFLFGAQLDAIIRAQVTSALSGNELDLRERS